MSKHFFDVSQKTILIIGASSGIGEHFAKTLAEAGATLLLAARRQDRLSALKENLHAHGRRIETYSVDVANEHSVADLITAIEQGSFQIDVVINTAGMQIRNNFENYTADEWRRVMQVNLDGTWFVSQAVAKHMMANNIAGSLIHISSVLDTRTLKRSSHPYHASKAAVGHLTRSLALELAEKNIRVNVIAPGFFETDLNRTLLQSDAGQAINDSIPMQRTGQLNELDGAMLLLASDASSYMTGSTLRIDGGYATDHIKL